MINIQTFFSDIHRLSPRLKAVLGTLLAVALLLALRTAGVFGIGSTADISGQLNANENGVLPAKAPAPNIQLVFNEQRDTDGDGLNDDDEQDFGKLNDHDADSDGDGFYDGEELITGYDPEKDDRSESVGNPLHKTNLTLALIDNITAKIFAGAIQPKRLDKGDLQKNIEDIAFATLDAALENKDSTTRIVLSSDDPQAQALYLQQLSELLEEPVLTIISGGSQPTFVIASQDLVSGHTARARVGYMQIADTFSEAYDHMSAVTVPPSFKTWHVATLDLLHSMVVAHRELALAPTDDPVRSMIAVNLIGRQMLIAQGLLQNLRILVAKNKVAIPNSTLFTTLDLLNINETR